MVKQALDAWGRLDVVVHVAGILRDRMIFNMTEEECGDSVIAVHLKGFLAISKPASIRFRQQRAGRIIGFSSGSGLRGNPWAGELRCGQGRDRRDDQGRLSGSRAATVSPVNGISPSANTRMTQSVPDSRPREARAARGIAEGFAWRDDRSVATGADRADGRLPCERRRLEHQRTDLRRRRRQRLAALPSVPAVPDDIQRRAMERWTICGARFRSN